MGVVPEKAQKMVAHGQQHQGAARCPVHAAQQFLAQRLHRLRQRGQVAGGGRLRGARGPRPAPLERGLGMTIILKGAFSFMMCMVLAILLLCVFPELATWLPEQLMG